MKYYSDVKKGILQKGVRELIQNDLPIFEGKRVEITIKRVSAKRSLQQNAYYWYIVVQEQLDCFKERWGDIFDKTQVHEWNKANIFAEEHVDESTGEIFKIPKSSTASGKMDFEEKMEMIRNYFERVFEWRIPLPNENRQMEFED